MLRFIAALLGFLGLVSVSTEASAQAQCREFSQVNCIRFDVPSAAQNGNIPNGANGRPGGPQTMRALQAGTVQPGGQRTIVVIVWGLGNMPAAAVGAYQHRLPHTEVQSVRIDEVSPTMAPRFDSSYTPPGPARAFRVTYNGGMVSVQFPRSAVSEGTIMMICPDGASLFPDRATVRDGVRAQNAYRFNADDMKRWAHEQVEGRPRFDRVTTLPIVW